MGLENIVVLLVIALILFGPEDLPDVARALGKIVYEVRKAINDLTQEFQDVVETPADTLNKAFQEVSSRSKLNLEKTVSDNKQDSAILKKQENEELYTYEGEKISNEPVDQSIKDPLAELPQDIVSYEEN